MSIQNFLKYQLLNVQNLLLDVKKKLNTNLNCPGNFITSNLSLDPLIQDKWSCCMNHYTWKEIRENLNTTIKYVFERHAEPDKW